MGYKLQEELNRQQANKNVQDTIDAQREMSEYEYSKNLEQWERANLYNEPTQQMARLREGGLNPAMIYGSGGAKTVATQLPKYQAPRPDYSGRQAKQIGGIGDPLLMLNAYQDFQIKNTQIDTLKAERDTKELYRNWLMNPNNITEVIGGDISGKGAKIQITKSTNWKELFGAQLDAQKATVEKIKQDTHLGWQKERSEVQTTGLKKFEYDFWKELKAIGGMSKLGIPLIKMFLGR